MKETLIHAIAQLVVTAAVAIYFYKKNKEIIKQLESVKTETEESCNELRSEVNKLKSDIKILKDIISKTHGIKFKDDVSNDLQKIKALEQEEVEDEEEEEEQADLREEQNPPQQEQPIRQEEINKSAEINKKKKNLSPPKFRKKNV